jgi:beta-phosphoglucomutase-like phosphatase (HAD superfamily)
MTINAIDRPVIRGIVFDFDATLMDTEDYWYLADRRLLAESGVDFTREMKEKYIGRSLDDMVADLFRLYRLTLSVDEVKVKKNAYFLEAARGKVGMFPRMKEMYGMLKALGLPMAVATGTDFRVVDAVLADNAMEGDFAFVLTAAEVKRGKPFPDIYLRAAEKLSLRPADILVFEDSPYGVESALAAGCRCVAIPYLLNRTLDSVFARADVLVEEGIQKMSPGAVLAWITDQRRAD